MSKRSVSVVSSRPWLRRALLALAALALPVVLSGCLGGGRAPQPLGQSELITLGEEMTKIERLSADEVSAYNDRLQKELDEITEQQGAAGAAAGLARNYFLLGYLNEYRITALAPEGRTYREAMTYYQLAAKASGYGSQANFRLGILGVNSKLGPRPESLKIAKGALGRLTMDQRGETWLRTPPLAGEGGSAALATDKAEPAGAHFTRGLIGHEALRLLDTVYSDPTAPGWDATYYRVVDQIVKAFNQVTPRHGAVLALLFLAVLVKIITLPLSSMAFRGMRDMQRIQPLLKELQEKHKADRAKLAEEQMRLMKEHKVSPMSGCVPMLIQLPIFIIVYQAVRVYSYQFSGTSFLWIHSLAEPDLPLLILYAVSMFLTQKLTTMPSADPQQRMMQTQMTVLMPIMFVFILSSLASAFVLYWFFLNVVSSAHQYYLMRKLHGEEVVAPAPLAKPSQAPKAGSPRWVRRRMKRGK